MSVPRISAFNIRPFDMLVHVDVVRVDGFESGGSVLIHAADDPSEYVALIFMLV